MVTDTIQGWKGVPRHDPKLEKDLCARISSNPQDEEARGLLAQNNLRYAMVVGKSFLPSFIQIYGYTLDEFYSEIAEITLHVANSPKYTGDRPFRHYLAPAVYRKLINLKRDIIAKRQHRGRNIEDLAGEDSAEDRLSLLQDDSVLSPDVPIYRSELRAALTSLMEENLTPKQRRNIELFYLVEAGSKSDISRSLNCSRANVGISISDGLRILREVIREKDLQLV